VEEMVWLSGVFQQEMKMKKAASKKCARMVQKHFTDKTLVRKCLEIAEISKIPQSNALSLE
jgi:E1A-binding protein p400